MVTQELLQEEMKPLSLELEYADDAAVEKREGSAIETETHSKKDQIISLYETGVTDIAQITRRVGARPSYVAQVLQNAGHLDGYFDLYTTTGREQNVYSRFFR